MPDERQDRCIALCTEINQVLAGLPVAEAHTTLALAVLCSIVATTDDTEAERESAARGFGKMVLDFIKRTDMVEWIKASIVRPPNTSEKPQ